MKTALCLSSQPQSSTSRLAFSGTLPQDTVDRMEWASTRPANDVPAVRFPTRPSESNRLASRLACMALSLAGVSGGAYAAETTSSANDTGTPVVQLAANDNASDNGLADPIATPKPDPHKDLNLGVVLDQDLAQLPAPVQTAVTQAKAVSKTVTSVKDFVQKERSLAKWHTSDKDADGVLTESQFDFFRGHVALVDHVGFGGGLSSPHIQTETGAVVDSELVGGMRQSTIQNDNGDKLTLGFRAGIDAHLEDIEHANFGVGKPLTADLQADNGLHTTERITANFAAYNSFTYHVSPKTSIEASGSLGMSDTLFNRTAAPNPLTTTGGNLTLLTTSGWGPTATADITVKHDISNVFSWLGPNVQIEGVFKNSAYFNVDSHSLGYSYRIGTAVDKKLDVHAFGKQHNITLTVGAYADKQPGSSVGFHPEVGVHFNF